MAAGAQHQRMGQAAADLGDDGVEATDFREEGMATLLSEEVEPRGRLCSSIGVRVQFLRIEWLALHSSKAELSMLIITPDIDLVELDRARKLLARCLLLGLVLGEPTPLCVLRTGLPRPVLGFTMLT